MVKIIDKINEKVEKGDLFFSFEYFPPKTDEGVQNLVERQKRMFAYGPTFCDITWGAGGSTADLTLDIAKRMQNEASGGALREPIGHGVWLPNREGQLCGALAAGGHGDHDAPDLHQHACGEAEGGAGQGENGDKRCVATEPA